ncbi:hypothetical protein E3J62_01095 [candidate division TA06 bacterium]|uniref:Uncharacterized protein n=1 Tax=candidate division TA06 bacterium TaxID=2250710 RepID=A0A523UYF1_UNCT6|nr:MAG: hypothetical protein E3J62_01095 [candidate division TA06 bacterium]
MAKVELSGEKTIRLDSSANLEDIYKETDRLRLPVEPTSRSKPIVKFLHEGGYGYGSLTEGSLASKIFKLSWESGGRSYEYGLEGSTLYNAGYPLQRIVDMGKSRILQMDFGQIVSATFLAVDSSSPVVRYIKQDVEEFSVPGGATNAMFVDEKVASLLGLTGRGLLATFDQGRSVGEDAKEAWERRFFEDSLPRDLEKCRILTVKSNIKALMDVAGADSYFLTLASLKGFVINIYCSPRIRIKIDEAVASLKHCYLL